MSPLPPRDGQPTATSGGYSATRHGAAGSGIPGRAAEDAARRVSDVPLLFATYAPAQARMLLGGPPSDAIRAPPRAIPTGGHEEA
jgi:hypothetical protein